MGWWCHLLKVEGKLLRGKFGMVGMHSPFTSGLQCFVLLCLGFGYFPLAGSSPPSPLPRASSRFVVLQEGRGGADQGSGTFLLIKCSLFISLWKNNNILIFFHSTFLTAIYKKKWGVYISPKKVLCNIFIIKTYTHRLYFYYYYYYFCHSQHCLSHVWTNSPILEVDGDKPLFVNGQIVPDSSKAWIGSELLLCLDLLLIKKYQTSHFWGKMTSGYKMQNNHCPQLCFPHGEMLVDVTNLCSDFPLGHLGDLQGQWHLPCH